ncbi:MAG TPA: OmpH family outer membrane protein [Bacteroidales bacterium]|nr:OmpH family outer membrane protein [Bacteroidales bacterium]
MKNLSLIFNAVLLIAVIVLFVLVLGKKSNSEVVNMVKEGDSLVVQKLPIAYVNIDSLLLNYTFAKNANEALISKQESSRATLNAKARQLQAEMDDFNRNLENQAFLSRERAENAQRDIIQKQQELQQLEANLTQQLMEQQQKMSEQLRDTVNAFLKDYNKSGKYQLILSNTGNDNILFAGKGYDITEEVIKELNDRYAKGKK